MAELARAALEFNNGCPDCGGRRVDIPASVPEIGDDFDWRLRDYDSFRLFMLDELAARFPERKRWTPADLEVVLTELFATLLDQLSDMSDRVASEAYLETARRPETIYRLLKFIGYDAARQAGLEDDLPGTGDRSAWQKLESLWRDEPARMEAVRTTAPRTIQTQKRMVTLEDYTSAIEAHPLVERTKVWVRWGGSWPTVWVAVSLWNNERLDLQAGYTISYHMDLRDATDRFNIERGLPRPDWDSNPAIRTILRPFVDAYRPVGQEVLLLDAKPIGIYLEFTIQVNANYFQSEVRHNINEMLGRGTNGFFRPGRLRFGEDIYASDVIQFLMRLQGVENLCLNRFKRVGSHWADQAATGRIVLDGYEIAVCDNNPQRPEHGYYRLSLVGGRKG